MSEKKLEDFNNSKGVIKMENFKEIQAKHYAEHEASRAKYENKVGIYAITCNDHIVYVGKSTNLFNRFVAHEMNAMEPTERDYHTKKYTELREAVMGGATISYIVLEYCSEEQLAARESFYIMKYWPALNRQTPQGNKPVESIEKYWK